MTKRTKENFKVVVLLVALGFFAVLAVKTLWVGINLSLYSNAVVESGRYADEYYQIREEANAVYESVNASRALFYNSSDPYIKWISNMNNCMRIPFGMLMIFSPFIFVTFVRNYNIRKRRNKRARRQYRSC